VAAVDNDRQLQAEVRHALEAVTPPAPWLAARVVVDLRKRRKREGGVDMKVHEASWRGLSLAVVGVAAVIAAALVVVVLLVSRGLVPSSSVPAGVGDQATAQYVARVEADDQQFQTVLRPTPCNDFGYDSSACREKLQTAIAVLQKFQADTAHPPARLAGRHALLRADIARLEAMYQRHLSYIDAKDFNALLAEGPELNANLNSYFSDINGILSTPR
jgi:hypothetical protein